MLLTGENKSTQRSTCSGATLSTTDLPEAGLGLNLSLYGEILATNPLSHGKALHTVQHPYHCGIFKTQLSKTRLCNANQQNAPFFNLMF